MESALIAGRLFLLISTFVFPQLLGVLLYFRLTRFPKWIAFILGVLTPPALFIFLAPSFFFDGLSEAQLKGERCGMPAAAAGFLLLLGTVAQAFVSLIVQGYLFSRQSGRSQVGS